MTVFPFATLAMVAALTSCASVPARNTTLDLAHSRYAAVRADPQAAALAPEEMQRAADALRAADAAWAEKERSTTVDHLAYVAGQRVTIAQETATSRASQAVVAGAAAERDRLRLALRTAEADLAQRQLTESRRSDERKTAELAVAEAAALSEQGRTEQSQARVADLESELRELSATKTDRGTVVTLGDVLFDTGESRLLPASTRHMATLADVLKRDPQRTATIDGHTDSVGSDNANFQLSERRARSVADALVVLGVPSDRLSTRGHGARMPVADNGTAAGRQMNRRVEVVLAPR